MRPWIAGMVAAVASLMAAAAAEAGPFPVNTLFADFNVITNGNFATTSEVVGPVLVGGSLSGNGILDTSNTPQTCCTSPVPNYAEINVFGSNTGTWAEPSGIRAYVGLTNTGNFLGAGTVLTGYTFPGFNQPGAGTNAATFMNDIWGPLTGVSGNLATLTPNSSFNPATGELHGVAGPNGAVFSIALNTLNNFSGTLSLTGCFTDPTPCGAVINVTGPGNFVQGFSFPVADDIPGLPNVLFNFVGAMGVEFGSHGNFDASILAPLAVASDGAGSLIGDLVAQSVSATAPLGGEIHFAPFECPNGLCVCPPGFPGCSGGPPFMPDEPSPLALFGAGAIALAGFVALRRRRAAWSGLARSGLA